GPGPEAGAAPPQERPIDIARGLPSWMTGVPEQTEQQRAEAETRERQRREDNLAFIESQATDGFDKLSATDRMGIALRLTGRNLFGGLSSIQWPSPGHLALGLIDPRGPMMGVVSGLNMVINGVVGFARRPSWGGALKAATDIATGLTIILGSITALAGLVIGVMTAITILSFGTAAPVTGPIIAFCTTVMTTVGGWTIAVGKVALVLQALSFLKNLYEAATAENAQQLNESAEAMTQNASGAANVLMQVGMAKLSQVGGRALQSEIRAAGGGVRFAAQTGARGLPARMVTGVRQAGVRGYAGQVMGSAGRGMRGAWNYLSRTSVSQAWGGARSAVGRAWRGMRQAGRETPMSAREGFGRDFLLGKDIPRGSGFSGVRTAASEARATASAEMAAEMAAARRTAGAADEAAAAPGPRADAPEPAGPRTDAPEGAPRADAPEPSAPKRSDGTAEVADAPDPPAARERSAAESGLRESDELSSRQIANELDQVRENPSMLEGTPPNRRAQVGRHEWREQPGGRWCRHSPRDVCVLEFNATRAEMTAGKRYSPVRQLNEADDVYRARLQAIVDDPSLAASLDDAIAAETRLAELDARMAASEQSMAQPLQSDQQWEIGPLPMDDAWRRAHPRVRQRQIELINPDGPVNPSNITTRDLLELEQIYSRPGAAGDVKARLEGVQRELSYRRTTVPAIAQARDRYRDIARTAGPNLEREIIVDALESGHGAVWVSSRKEADRLWHTLDEMAQRNPVPPGQRPSPAPGTIAREPAALEGGNRPNLPFRGPERHPWPDRGANPSTHYNADVNYGGETRKIHIYWGDDHPPLPIR
ncbi:MAG TPA: hypothetical protein VFQ45_22125, partial [Longimicrobium sp.]|nr:hypothetical protein [Longimicrobium sp.]